MVAFQLSTSSSIALPPGHIYGLGLANSPADPLHQVEISVGECRDAGNSVDLVLNSTFQKKLAASWQVGDSVDGLFAGAVSADTWYHVFLIRKDADDSIDAGFDTDVAAAGLPSGYTAFRRLGAVLTDGSGEIIGFSQVDDDFLWNEPAADFGAQDPGTAGSLRTLSVPSGLRVTAFTIVTLLDTSPGVASTFGLISSPDQLDVVPNSNLFDFRIQAGDAGKPLAGVYKPTRTNLASQVRTRVTYSDSDLWIFGTTSGWRDARGKGES